MSEINYVLVTGGAGFIGSHCVSNLLSDGHKVVVVDNLRTGKKENLRDNLDNPDLTFLQLDLTEDFSQIENQLLSLDGKVSKIIHLAAQTSVIESIEKPKEDVIINYNVTTKLLDFAAKNKVDDFLFASSAAVYGNPTTFPLTEETTCAPLSPYGVNKLSCEYMLSYFAEQFSLRTKSFRFFNVYGPKQDPFSPYSGVISIFLERAKNNQDLKIFGDGKQTRDFIFVEDIASQLCSALFNEDTKSGVFNLATSREISITSLAELIIKVTGSNSKIVYEDERKGEIRRSVACIEKASKQLGFKTLLHCCRWTHENL